MVARMENEPSESDPPQHHGDGSAKYPGSPKLTDEERRQYDEIHERIVARLKQHKGRRSRWRPPEG